MGRPKGKTGPRPGQMTTKTDAGGSAPVVEKAKAEPLPEPETKATEPEAKATEPEPKDEPSLELAEDLDPDDKSMPLPGLPTMQAATGFMLDGLRECGYSVDLTISNMKGPAGVEPKWKLMIRQLAVLEPSVHWGEELIDALVLAAKAEAELGRPELLRFAVEHGAMD